MSVQLPEPETTAVVIAGASKWPFTTQFEASPQFKNSATEFKKFLLEQDGFGLPKDNLLDLFDTDDEQSVLIRKIANFLLGRQAALKSSGHELSDVIFYYVGHGGFDTGGGSAYFLAIRQTNSVDYLASSLAISSLRRALRENTRDVRHYLILDCCFAAAALAPYLQLSAAAQGLVTQIQEAFPPAGTALLCASGAVIPAKAKRGAMFTMFSEALLDVLRSGVANAPDILSLGETAIAVRSLLKYRYGDEAVRPEIHSPEQTQGSIADVPIFRNVQSASKNIAAVPLPEGTYLEGQPHRDKSASNSDAEPSASLDGLFREFDENDIPARIPGHPLTDNEWMSIPREVRVMLKQLEGLEVPIVNRVVLLALFVSFATSVALAILVSLYVFLGYTVPAPQMPMVFTALGTNIACFAVLLALASYRIITLQQGERIRDRITLRSKNLSGLVWERYPVMDLLRRPRNIVRYGGRAFLVERIRSELFGTTAALAISTMVLGWIFLFK